MPSHPVIPRATMTLRKLLSLILALLTCVPQLHADSADEFLDKYQQALAGQASITARFVLSGTTGTMKNPVHLSGIITWNADGDSPYMLLTMQRVSDSGNEEHASAILAAIIGDNLRLVDAERNTYYTEKLSQNGANLFISRADILILSLVYPSVLDSLRQMKSTFSEGDGRTGPLKVITCEEAGSTFSLAIDTDTLLPAWMERSSGTGSKRSVTRLELSGIHTSDRYPPVELMNVNDSFEFPKAIYSPTGFVTGQAAPEFSTRLFDGNSFTLSEHKGQWVFLAIRSGGTNADESSLPMYLELAADKLRANGAILIEVYTIPGGSYAPVKPYSPEFACINDELAGTYGARKSGLPCLIVIDQDGKIAATFVGYIPRLSERAVDEIVTRACESAKSAAAKHASGEPK